MEKRKRILASLDFATFRRTLEDILSIAKDAEELNCLVNISFPKNDDRYRLFKHLIFEDLRMLKTDKKHLVFKGSALLWNNNQVEYRIER